MISPQGQTDYIGGIHFQDGSLDFLQTAEGKVDMDDHAYYYNVMDHLGNVRLLVDKNGGVKQSTDYYPFGLVARGGSSADNKYGYNNKELQEETGWYDYGARMYDPAIGRFTCVDPISDQFPHVSTFNYAENSPIANVDLHGLQKVSIHLVGELHMNNNKFSTYASGTLDLGNNNSVNFSGAIDGVGEVSVSYSANESPKVSDKTSFSKGQLSFDVDKPRGIQIPNFLIKIGLENQRKKITPKNLEEALSLSKDDARKNDLMLYTFNSIENLLEQDFIPITALYDYDGSSGSAVNEKGESYERKFTHVFKGKVGDFEFSNDGITFKGRLVISYTQQENIQKDDEKK